ncbi:PucR family transcriptional regulator ligand-binding domain-containing protein [Actinotalea sp. Marseille-Q4924]|uniref:PucR family transcriptional regulator n=1 Tax=Actinotalea sp. Marseille-Q4924 TaxID=2866571 RepID=UPI001CE40A2F|nr:PucR family transcriptional regulator ligand-binding domain-containing protein [Actinotalea sp. Marseille-Q4924]
MVTVREIMTLAPLHGTYVLAGASGLDRVVTGVNVMEVPDIEEYVKEGELLLTTAYPVRDRPERLVELLPVLRARGLAGLAIKPLRYLERLPDRLAQQADALGFPVLIVPDGTSFNEVIGSVLAVVLAEYGAEPARTEAIRERLTGIALSGGGLEEIARTLAGALDRSVTIVDDDAVVLGGRPRATVEVGPPDADHGRWEFPITVAGVPRGRVLVGGEEEPTLGQRRLIRQACFAAGMHIAQALASIELDRRLGVVFLEELVTGTRLDAAALRRRARLFGWDLDGGTTVLVAACTTEPLEAGLQATARRVLGPRAVAWLRGTQVIALAPTAAAGTTGTTREEALARALEATGAGRTVVASGAPARELTDLPAGHATAQEALRIAHVTHRTAVRYPDLAFERLVLSLPRAELEAFVEDQIGPLVRHDEQADGELCRTLEEVLGLGNAAEAARRLFVHYNTMKHRLQRIGDLLGADLREPRTRLALALALEARRLVAAAR